MGTFGLSARGHRGFAPRFRNVLGTYATASRMGENGRDDDSPIMLASLSRTGMYEWTKARGVSQKASSGSRWSACLFRDTSKRADIPRYRSGVGVVDGRGGIISCSAPPRWSPSRYARDVSALARVPCKRWGH